MNTIKIYTNDSEKRENVISGIMKDHVLTYEMLDMILGEYLGSGISRAVFVYKPDIRFVIKVEISSYSANILEWRTWHNFKEDKRISKWLCPIKDISTHGLFLIQKRAKKIEDTSLLPLKLPTFLSDIKSDNFGWIGKQLVMVDYTWLKLKAETKLRTVKWT